MISIKHLINQIGAAICHQISARSISVGKVTLPVCARDTGIYVGFLISFVYLLVVQRKKENRLPPIHIIVIGLLFVSLMVLDGFTSYLGLRATHNWIRLLTGIGTGAFLAILLFPLFNYEIGADSSSLKVLKQLGKQAGQLTILVLTFVLFTIAPSFLGKFLFYFTGLAIVFTFFVVNLLILFLLPFWHRKVTRIKTFIIPSLTALVLCGIEFYLAFQFHYWFLKL